MADDTTLRLVQDVAGIQADVRHITKTQEEQWRKLDLVIAGLSECNRKLDQIPSFETRLEDVESGVEDYRHDKTKAKFTILGVAIGGGGISGVAFNALSRWFGNGG